MTGFLVIGSMNFDLTYMVDTFPPPHTKTRASAQWSGPGGSAANTAYMLARAGEQVRMLGCVGDDVFGAAALESLRSIGVDVSHVQIATGIATALCTIMLSEGDKRMVIFPGANERLSTASVGSKVFAGISHVHVATSKSETIAWAFAHARGVGATTSLEWNGRDYRTFAPAPHISFMNADELGRLEGATSDLQEFSRDLAARHGGVFAITAGASGAWATAEGAVEAVPVRRFATILDRTGGGDSFNAGFLRHWTRSKTLATCLDAGLALACEMLETRGTRPR
jgi:sugar/nucleoside kinase (ribokinase family)